MGQEETAEPSSEGPPTAPQSDGVKETRRVILFTFIAAAIILIAACAYFAYSAGYFGTTGFYNGGQGTWKQQYEMMIDSRDEWKSKHDSLMESRDEWKSKHDSLYASQNPNLKLTNTRVTESTRGFFTVHYDLNVKCDVINSGGTGTGKVALVITDKPTGSILISESQDVEVMKGSTETVSWKFEDMLNNRNMNLLDVSLTLTSQWME